MQSGYIHLRLIADVLSIFPMVNPLRKISNKKTAKVSCLSLGPKDFLIFCMCCSIIPHYQALSN